MGWNCLSIPKRQRCNRWSLGMDKEFHPTLHWACDYLSTLGLKLNHVIKRGLWYVQFVDLNVTTHHSLVINTMRPEYSTSIWQKQYVIPLYFSKEWELSKMVQEISSYSAWALIGRIWNFYGVWTGRKTNNNRLVTRSYRDCKLLRKHILNGNHCWLRLEWVQKWRKLILF